MLALYQQLFAGLHASQVEYCIWKNVQETPEALSGKGDIDLYISPGSHALFLIILRMNGFTRLISHKATPCVEHYYGYDAPSGKFCHLHCYFRIVTGESHIKQYVVPVEDYLANFPNAKNTNGVSEMHPALQYKLNLFRRSIKLSCLPGALLFFRERQGYRQERILLEQALCETPATDGNIRDSGWLDKIQTSSSFHGEIIAGIRNRIYFRHWSRFPALLTPVYRYGTIFLRLAGKLRHRRKMLPLGTMIAVTSPGPDSEAVTMLESRIASWLGAHFNVVTVQDTARSFPHDTPKPANVESDTNQSLSGAAGSFWRSFNRHRKIKSALQQTMAGSIVIWLGKDPARQTVESQPCKETSQSLVTTFISRTSATLFNAEPHIDILLRLSDNFTADIDEKPISTDSAATVRVSPEAASKPAKGPIQISISECHSTCEATWKCEVWRALVAFQP